ncbi:hypothetical protein DICVIV_07225 [Dictyocaulus viviparus]|uniref:Uncharacterized protein n=1 Tax=Dictyocaulus viviparus TaxID=29172 RepID=A0A0D8XWJ2_DICVI|nr:hypothetical protein DICVIV_07225 [Dictyocaulus viviparus]
MGVDISLMVVISTLITSYALIHKRCAWMSDDSDEFKIQEFIAKEENVSCIVRFRNVCTKPRRTLSYKRREDHADESLSASCEVDGDEVVCYCHESLCNVNGNKEFQEAITVKPLSNSTLQSCLIAHLTHGVIPGGENQTSESRLTREGNVLLSATHSTTDTPGIRGTSIAGTRGSNGANDIPGTPSAPDQMLPDYSNYSRNGTDISDNKTSLRKKFIIMIYRLFGIPPLNTITNMNRNTDELSEPIKIRRSFFVVIAVGIIVLSAMIVLMTFYFVLKRLKQEDIEDEAISEAERRIWQDISNRSISNSFKPLRYSRDIL